VIDQIASGLSGSSSLNNSRKRISAAKDAKDAKPS